MGIGGTMKKIIEKLAEFNSVSHIAPVYLTIYDDESGVIFTSYDIAIERFADLTQLDTILNRLINESASQTS
jgi:hypothetical protein